MISFLIIAKNFILKKTISPLWPAFTWLLTVTVLLSLPGTAFPHEKWYDKVWLDKWIHIGLYTMLSVLFCRYAYFLLGKKVRFFVYAAVLCFVHGVIMEFVQKYFIQFRSFDVRDIAADGIGSALGLIISIRAYIKK